MIYKNLRIKDGNNIYNFCFDQNNLLTKNLSVNKINNVKNISWLNLQNKIIQKDLTLTTVFSDALIASKVTTDNLIIDSGSASLLGIKANNYILRDDLILEKSLECEKINKIIVEDASVNSSYNGLNFHVNKLFYRSINVSGYDFEQHLEIGENTTITLNRNRFYRITVFEEKKSNYALKRKISSFVGGLEGPEINLTSKWEYTDSTYNYEVPCIVSFNILQKGNELTFSNNIKLKNSTYGSFFDYNRYYRFLIRIYLIQIF